MSDCRLGFSEWTLKLGGENSLKPHRRYRHLLRQYIRRMSLIKRRDLAVRNLACGHDGLISICGKQTSWYFVTSNANSSNQMMNLDTNE